MCSSATEYKTRRSDIKLESEASHAQHDFATLPNAGKLLKVDCLLMSLE